MFCCGLGCFTCFDCLFVATSGLLDLFDLIVGLLSWFCWFGFVIVFDVLVIGWFALACLWVLCYLEVVVVGGFDCVVWV